MVWVPSWQIAYLAYRIHRARAKLSEAARHFLRVVPLVWKVFLCDPCLSAGRGRFRGDHRVAVGAGRVNAATLVVLAKKHPILDVQGFLHEKHVDRARFHDSFGQFHAKPLHRHDLRAGPKRAAAVLDEHAVPYWVLFFVFFAASVWQGKKERASHRLHSAHLLLHVVDVHLPVCNCFKL
ncbi:MAG: hypothetical protein CL454_00785 [Acidimicrobiaceae bacterium]|nr:hypothetical protein [Acidimicrobiaceae bacterium]